MSARPGVGEEALLHWVKVLTGLPPEYVREARRRIHGWEVAHVNRELLAPTADAAVAAALLVESVDRVVRRGVPWNKLLSKLRADPDVWPTWAEIRAADILGESVPTDAELTIEAGRAAGAHADLRLVMPGAIGGQSVEFKALGLSDAEVAFCQRMTPALERMVPPRGIFHGHARIDAEASFPSREARRDIARGARRALKRVPNFPAGLAGATMVAHGVERSYLHRLGRLIAEVIEKGQLPAEDQGWVAFYWSNGAPLNVVADFVPWDELPERVAGVMFMGSGVDFPMPMIHNFVHVLGRGADDSGTLLVSSKLGDLVGSKPADDVAAKVLRRFEHSSGVRPTVLRAHGRELVRRDGSRRILPYNLLLDTDPPESGAVSILD